MAAPTLAFSTNAFTRFSLLEALAGIAENGFTAVEILADTPHADPPKLDEFVGREVRRELDRLGLKVSNINCNCSFSYWMHAPPEPYFEPSLISPVEQYRVDRAERIRKSIDFAATIGAKALSITSGRPLGGVPPVRANELLQENLAPLLDYADRADVNIGIECEPGLYLEYATELRELIDAMGHPRLGANLDVGHSYVLGESLAGAFEVLKGRIWNCHIEDLPGRKHYHTIPGHGNFPWGELKDAMSAVGYAGYATVELYTEFAEPYRAAAESYRFLKPWVESFR